MIFKVSSTSDILWFDQKCVCGYAFIPKVNHFFFLRYGNVSKVHKEVRRHGFCVQY